MAAFFAILGTVGLSTAYAGEDEPYTPVADTVTVINPVYDGTLTAKNIIPHRKGLLGSGTNGNVFNDPDDAGEYLKEQMKKRVNIIEVGIPVQISTSTDVQALFEEKSESIANKAMAHTGNPVEGDYIKYQYGGYRTSANFLPVSGSTYNMMVTYDVTYFTTAAEEEQVTSAVKSALAAMDLKGRTGYDKARIIYDWVAQCADYDYSALSDDQVKPHTAYNCIKEHSCVCQGYSLLLYRMLLEAGIDNRMFGGGNHIWNAIKVGSAYHMSDATWDSAGYGKGCRHDNFLKGVSDFSSSADQHSGYMSDLFDPLDGYDLAANAYGCAAHSWDPDYTVEVAPTRQSEGRQSIHCANCEMTKGEMILPVLPPCKHVWDIVTVSPASFTVLGVEQKHCKECGEWGEQLVIPKAAAPTLSKKAYVYNGKIQKPAVSIKSLSAPNEYTVAWTNCKDVGTQTATVTLAGSRFKGVKKVSFTINPKGTSVSSLSRGSNCFTVKWKKQTAKMSKTPVTGYQIRYSLSSSMAGARTATVKGYTKYSSKISKLKAKKKYYVQVRTYKTVSGKNYYSAWSAKKYVTTR